MTGILICFSTRIVIGSIDDFSFPSIQGYKLVQDYPVYTPEDLWDYINGAAETYVAFHFLDLNIAEYLNDNGERIKVEVYKHRSSDYAYGIYCSERYPDYNFIDVGAQGYAEPGLVHFVSGPHYVKVMSNSSVLHKNDLTHIARRMSAWLDENPTLPEQLTIFPVDGKLVKSECFISNNFLGHEFLKDAYIANYEFGDQKFNIFIFYRMSASECTQIVHDYLRFAGQEIENIGDGQYTFEDRYNGEINLVLEGNVIYGFLGCNDSSIINDYTKKLQQNLKKSN